MIRILIAEDNPDKAAIVQRECLSLLPEGSISVKCVSNTTAAGELLEQNTFDLLVLDVQMPSREGEGARQDGGVRFLRAMYQTRRPMLPKYIFGLTEYADELAKYKPEFEERNWHVIAYTPNADEWRQRLAAQIFHIADLLNRADEPGQTDLAIITANEEVELSSVLALPGGWKAKEILGDPTIYHTGCFARNGRALSVVAAAALEMGMPAATALSMKLIYEFRPRYLVMVGIAAGVKGAFGDILIADVAFDYGSGKVRKGPKDAETRFLPDPHPIPLDALLKAKLSFFKTQTDLLEKIRRTAIGVVPDRLNVRMGPLGSGASVVEDRDVVVQVQSLWRKLVGVEMETYGVFLAGRMSKEPRPSVFSVKSICDFADSRKADEFQRYAAFTSANFVYEFALAWLIANPTS